MTRRSPPSPRRPGRPPSRPQSRHPGRPQSLVALLLGLLAPLATPLPLFAQDIAAGGALSPFSAPAGRVVVSERTDFSRYEDGRYVGHVYREARLDLDIVGLPDGAASYNGEALVLEETLRDMRAAARRLDGVVPVSFTASRGGVVTFRRDEGYPILRGVPASPAEPIPTGRRWTGEGVVVVRPRPDSPATRIPVLVEYEYAGATKYGETQALAIKARYAVRYRGGDRLGDPAMVSAMGGRTADIVIAASDGATLFIRETVDETYSYAGGAAVRLKGFILHFHRGSLPADRDRIASLLVPGAPAGAAPPGAAQPGASAPGGISPGGQPAGTLPPASPPAGSPLSGGGQPVAGGAFELARGEKGLTLLLFDLRFVADGDELLPSERGRLDAIAAALARIPDRAFLVEGHTADVGRPAGQYELSERRAKRIVDELAARGIPAGRFVYRGLGADKPIAPNDTEANRARNRRVEITILD